MPSQLYRTTVAEIDRDDHMIVLGLLRQLTALHTEQVTLALASGRIGDPLDLCKRIEAIAATSRAHCRRLNDARVNRRGRWPRELPDDPQVPVALRHFTRNGPHVGNYTDLRALAREAISRDATLPELERYVDLDGLAVDLHLQGALWTLDHDGKIHAFRCPHDDEDPPTKEHAEIHVRTPPPAASSKPKKDERPRRRPRGRR